MARTASLKAPDLSHASIRRPKRQKEVPHTINGSPQVEVTAFVDRVPVPCVNVRVPALVCKQEVQTDSSVSWSRPRPYMWKMSLRVDSPPRSTFDPRESPLSKPDRYAAGNAPPPEPTRPKHSTLGTSSPFPECEHRLRRCRHKLASLQKFDARIVESSPVNDGLEVHTINLVYERFHLQREIRTLSMDISNLLATCGGFAIDTVALSQLQTQVDVLELEAGKQPRRARRSCSDVCVVS